MSKLEAKYKRLKKAYQALKESMLSAPNKPTVEKAPVVKPPVKTVPVKKAPAKKAPVKKAPVKRTSRRKSV